MKLKELELMLKASSARDTCWPGCVENWSPENPACGHCVMYMLFVNEFFGGSIIFVEVIFPDGVVHPHYFNLLDGEDVDLSGSQFPDGIEFRNRRVVTREYVLSLPDGEATRYGVFRARVFRDHIEPFAQ